MKFQKFKISKALACILSFSALGLSVTASDTYVTQSGIELAAASMYDQAMIEVSGPNGFYHQQRLSANASANLTSLRLADGAYRYQVFFISNLNKEVDKGMSTPEVMAEQEYPTVKSSGRFVVKNGQIQLKTDLVSEEQ